MINTPICKHPCYHLSQFGLDLQIRFHGGGDHVYGYRFIASSLAWYFSAEKTEMLSFPPRLSLCEILC